MTKREKRKVWHKSTEPHTQLDKYVVVAFDTKHPRIVEHGYIESERLGAGNFVWAYLEDLLYENMFPPTKKELKQLEKIRGTLKKSLLKE